jgi:hypothetical protein
MNCTTPNRHNKSNKTSLSLLGNDDATLKKWLDILNGSLTILRTSPNPRSPCSLLNAADGRFTYGGKKVAFGYQLVAFAKFGRERLQTVAPSKKRNDLVISHICGTRNCCISRHLVLEPKWVNDERVHCHFVLRRILERSGLEGMEKFWSEKWCPHSPMCCLDKEEEEIEIEIENDIENDK